jgi:hypothetical protein
MSSYRLATGPRGGLCLLSRIHPVAEYVDRLGQITSGLGISAFNCSGSVMMDAFLHGFNITTDALHRLLGENRRGL